MTWSSVVGSKHTADSYAVGYLLHYELTST